jgi:hypothetical protein
MCGNITEQLLKDFFQLWGFLASTDWIYRNKRRNPTTSFYLDEFWRFQRQGRTVWNDFFKKEN